MSSLEKWKMIYGFTMLLLIGLLAGMVALAKVEQVTSHGLEQIITALTLLSAGFAHWAFGGDRTPPGGAA